MITSICLKSTCFSAFLFICYQSITNGEISYLFNQSSYTTPAVNKQTPADLSISWKSGYLSSFCHCGTRATIVIEFLLYSFTYLKPFSSHINLISSSSFGSVHFSYNHNNFSSPIILQLFVSTKMNYKLKFSLNQSKSIDYDISLNQSKSIDYNISLNQSKSIDYNISLNQSKSIDYNVNIFC